jgi:hypothetical protein
MKTILIKIACFVALIYSPILLNAQSKPKDTLTNMGGVYMTSADYQNSKLTFPIDCIKPGGDNIKVHNLFWNQTIDVVCNGKKRTLQKEDVYAYRDCDGVTYRFYKNADYIISSTKDLYIYIMQTQNVPSPDSKIVNKYFFSKGPNGEIKELTVSNLQNAFQDNKKFCNLLTAQFSHGEIISEYDFHTRTYKVSQLYESSID